MALAEQSIDEEMAATWKEIQERHAAENPEPEPVKTEPTIEAELEPKVDTRARDEAGKFVKTEQSKEQKSEPAQKIQKEVKEQAAQPGGDKVEPESKALDNSLPQRDITRPPSTWKPQAREDWAKLPERTRAEIHRREMDFQNGQAQLLPDARLGNAMRSVTEPYRAIIEQSYGSPDRAMQAFLQSAGTLQLGSPQQKLQEIVRISQQFGIDLSQLSGQSQPQSQQQFADPRVDQLLQNMQQQEQQRQAAEQRQLETLATAWLNEVDTAGNPKRPYLSDVMPEMSILIPQIKQANPLMTHAQVLEQAYDRAVWANPDTRAALQEKQQSELVERQRAANQSRVQEAKRAASVNVPRRGSMPSPAKPGSIDQTLESLGRELGLLS